MRKFMRTRAPDAAPALPPAHAHDAHKTNGVTSEYLAVLT